MKLTKQFFFLLPLLYAVQVSAQQSPVASGGNASGTGGSAAYSYGQVFDASVERIFIAIKDALGGGGARRCQGKAG